MFFLGAVKPLPQSSLEPGPSQASFHVLFNTVSWVRCPVSSQSAMGNRVPHESSQTASPPPKQMV